MSNNSPRPPFQKSLLIKSPKLIDESLEKFHSFFKDLHKFAKEVISFELILQKNYFFYQIVAPPSILPLIKSLVYTDFKDAEIIEKTTIEPFHTKHQIIAEFGLKRYNLFPIKTKFTSRNDPYLSLSAILSKLDHFKEGAVLQLVLYPVSDPWIKKFIREKFYFIIGALNSLKRFLEKPFLDRDFVRYYDELKNKFASPHFSASLRLLAYGSSDEKLKENFSLLEKSLDKFKNGDINSLTKRKLDSDHVRANFDKRILTKHPMTLNAREAAAIFRFPDSSLNIKTIDRASSKKVEAPQNLPIAQFLQDPQISCFATTNFRDSFLPFGADRVDRNRHLYVVGKTGMGKSKLIELLAIADIKHGKGVGIIDPHGDLANEIMDFIPPERVKDVIYFNPTDKQFPVGFNPLECSTPESKHQVVTGFVAIFKKLFGASWTNRLEHVLRFTLLALIEVGDTTVVDIVRMLTNSDFRQNTIAKINDPVVKSFWVHEFASWNEKFDNEAIVPLINQVGQFISNEYIRNTVSQKKSAINFYQAMNEGKIIIVNIAKGKLGEDNSSLLGSMIITKIQEAVMARVALPAKQRRAFYLYVDEFQNFATDSFNEILSEARKFNLSLTIAHQYLAQLSPSIRKTVFGNVGSFISFRLGPEDARYLSKEFAPQITADDLINLNFREIYVKLSTNGKTSPPFSASTITVPTPKNSQKEKIIENARRSYAISKKEIENSFAQDKQTANLISNISQDENELPVFAEPIV